MADAGTGPEERRRAEVPAPVRAGKRRAEWRAIGATMVALATIGLVILWVAKIVAVSGIRPAHLWYLVMAVCLALFLWWERRGWREGEEARAERRRRRRPSAPLRRPAPAASAPVVHRTRPHPSRQAVDAWWGQLIVVAIVVAAVASAVAVFLSAASE